MPRFVTNIQGAVLSNYVGKINYFSSLPAVIGRGDYIHVNNWIAYIQEFSRVYEAYTYTAPSKIGLKNQFNKPMVTVQISY